MCPCPSLAGARLLDISETESSVGRSVPRLIRVQVNPASAPGQWSAPCHLSPDGERPDEAVDGAVAAPVGRAVGHRAEHGAAESLWTRDIITPGHGHVSHSPMHVSGVLPAACLLLPAVLVVAQGMDSQSVVHTVSPTW